MRVIHQSLVNSPHKGQWCGAFMFSLICAWINSWVNNCQSSNLRRHHAHYDTTVMETDHDKLMLFSMLMIWKYHHMYSCLTIPIINMTKEIKTSTQWNDIIHWFLAVTKQLYKWYFPSVRLSVCLSVTPFWLCSHHRIIMKFSGVITNDQSKVHAKGQGQRSKVKVTEVTTQLNRFRTVTPVWIHI